MGISLLDCADTDILFRNEVAYKGRHTVIFVQCHKFIESELCILESVFHCLLQAGDEVLSLLCPVALKIRLSTTQNINFLIHSALIYFALKNVL